MYVVSKCEKMALVGGFYGWYKVRLFYGSCFSMCRLVKMNRMETQTNPIDCSNCTFTVPSEGATAGPNQDLDLLLQLHKHSFLS